MALMSKVTVQKSSHPSVWNCCFISRPKAFFGTYSAVFVLMSMLSLGCSGAKYRIDSVTAGQFVDAKAVTTLVDKGITIHVVQSGYGGGGLLGAAINASVESNRRGNAARRIAPLRDASADIDFQATLWNTVVPVLEAASWPQLTNVSASRSPLTFTEEAYLGNSWLVLDTEYELTGNASVLEIRTTFKGYIKGRSRVVVVGRLLYQSAAVGDSVENEDAVDLWAQNNAAAYRYAVSEGIRETGKMLVYALAYASSQTPDYAEPPTVMSVALNHARGDFGINIRKTRIKANIIESDGNRAILYSPDGWWRSVAVRHIEYGENLPRKASTVQLPEPKAAPNSPENAPASTEQPAAQPDSSTEQSAAQLDSSKEQSAAQPDSEPETSTETTDAAVAEDAGETEAGDAGTAAVGETSVSDDVSAATETTPTTATDEPVVDGQASP